MKARSRLKHTATGLLGFLISRNNDLYGYWAPGLLYVNDDGPPQTIELDLLSGVSQPFNQATRTLAARYAERLRAALVRQKFAWDQIIRATVTFEFNAAVPVPDFPFPCAGDPFICNIDLRTVQGTAVTVQGIARCRPCRFGSFTRSTRSGEFLHRFLSQPA